MSETELDESTHLLATNSRSNDPTSGISNRTSDIDQIDRDEVTTNDIVYGISAFWETLKPVAVTMILASLACNYIVYYDESTSQEKDSGLEFYTAQEGADNSDRIEASIINAIIVVSVMAVFTFLIVFIYWMGWTKCLYVYLIIASVLLLSVLGGLMFYTAIQKFNLLLDYFSFFFILYNFAVVGVLSIFYSSGIPKYITQCYLICTSVIMAWNLSSLDEYTCWALLVALAFYDLCAVLTPCGPLKALVGLMHEKKEPLPGLLYEASIQNTRRNNSRSRSPQPPEIPLEEQTISNDVSNSSHQSLHENEENIPPQETQDNISENLINSNQQSDEQNKNQLHGSEESSIKLGLGDFVFYSVLVSRASMYGFAEFFTCFLIVLSGLGFTLVLLTLYKIPLPALPFSILFGVLFYFLTRFCVTPFLNNLSTYPIYV